jgi:pimeloyl-ACP methyl ester carboxylesterase
MGLSTSCVCREWSNIARRGIRRKGKRSCPNGWNLCERLVLVDAGGLGREVNWILRIATLPAAEYVMPVLFPSFTRGWADPVFRLADRVGLRSVPAIEIWRSYSSLTDADSRRAFIRTMRSVIDPGGQSVSAMDRLYLAEQIPTLIVWGEKDRIIPLAHAHQALRAAPHSRLEIMPGVGHFPQSEDPASFVEILKDFLRSSGPSTFTTEGHRDSLQRGPG